MSKSFHFFATKRDLESIIMEVESKRMLQYIRAGLFDSPEIFVVVSGLNIPNLGIASHGDQVHEEKYLVDNLDSHITIREVPQFKGGMLYAIDQKINKQTIALRPGGLYQNIAIIAGEVSTCTENPASKELMNLFAQIIRRQFIKIKSFFVGPQAEQFLDVGYRLTTSVKSPKEIDLSRG
jgi:hypothetical protein